MVSAGRIRHLILLNGDFTTTTNRKISETIHSGLNAEKIPISCVGILALISIRRMAFRRSRAPKKQNEINEFCAATNANDFRKLE